jgi:hypothetical protein
MALTAGEIGPDRMKISGLLNVTVFTPAAFIKLDTLVGVCQTRPYTYLGRGGTVRKDTLSDAGNLYKRALATGHCLIFFIVTGTRLSILIAPDG